MVKHLTAFIIAFSVSLAAIGYGCWAVLGPVGVGENVVFVVPQNDDGFDVPRALKAQGLIRNELAFRLFDNFFGPETQIVPGGYRLGPSMTAWAMVTKLRSPPQLVWVSIREGLRKEQIGEILGPTLGWTLEQEREWNAIHDGDPEYEEGVYFPDTYLLPSDEPVPAVAKRFLDRFEEKVGPSMGKFAEKNIKWTTAIKIASLIEREAGGAYDMPLIAGIIWNRLDKDMRLDIDATLQYVKGNSEIGWWPRVVPQDKFVSSPYNTYRNEGLPPGPISNPGLTAIEAVLNPEQTDCLFYLHSSDRQIHCAVTYEEHMENIEKYL